MKKILIFLLLILSLTGYGTVWYVDEAGNDGTGDGSSGNPWALVSYACTQATAGDTIYVNPGTITESARIAVPVGVSIYGAGATSIIVSTYVATSSTDASIYLNSTAGSTVDGNQSISYLTIDGASKTALRCIAVNYRNNVVLHDLIIEDFAYGGIRYYVSDAYPTLYATGNAVYNCTITNSAGQVDPGSNYPGDLRISGMNGFLCYNNYFDNTVSAAGNNGNSIAFARNKKTKIHDNEFHRLNSEIDKWNFFCETTSSSGDNEYYNNDHYGLAKVSFGGSENTNDGDCTYGFKVYNNNFYNNAVGARVVGGETQTYYCLNLEGNKWDGVFIYNNYIQNFGFGIELSTPKGDTGGYWDENWVWNNVNVYYNIIDGIGYDGYNYGTGIIWINETNVDVTGTFTNILIANNVIVNKDNGYQGIRISGNGTMTGLDISNNIVCDFSNYGIYIDEHSTDGFALTNADITYNDMYSNGTDTVYLEGTITQTNVDLTTGNITTNPTFVSTSDFHLQPTSPCRDAGIDVSAITGGTDFHGASRYGSAYDIGAFEYGVGRMMILNGTTMPTINYKLILIDH